MSGLIALLFYLSKIVLNCHTCLLVNSVLFSTFCLSFLCPFILAMLLGCCTCAFCLAFGIFQYKKKKKKKKKKQMRKSAPFQIAGKLRGTLTDNGFKQVQIAYLAVINNLSKLVQLSYTLSKQIRPLESPRACLSLTSH